LGANRLPQLLLQLAPQRVLELPIEPEKQFRPETGPLNGHGIGSYRWAVLAVRYVIEMTGHITQQASLARNEELRRRAAAARPAGGPPRRRSTRRVVLRRPRFGLRASPEYR